MRRIVVAGASNWNDRAMTTTALRRVMEVYKGPYTLVCDKDTGAGRYAAAVAKDHGWSVDTYEVSDKCDVDCPTANHRRPGGATGDFCPTARYRMLAAQLNLMPDLCIMLHRPAAGRAPRVGQELVKDRGIALWQYTQTKGARDGKP